MPIVSLWLPVLVSQDFKNPAVVKRFEDGPIAMFRVRPKMWRPWTATWKSACDSIVYGIMTGAVFAWLWPHA